ncbi:FAD binding domain-containing protein [Melanogaster broomeanus]|nr:FAD binding domain-containing protein [Melanogaster broomeanus]
MTSKAPVLIVGAGPAGLVAALTLLRNGIQVRIIDKEPVYRLGERGSGMTPRSLELFRFLEVPEVDETAKPPFPLRIYKPGTLTPVKTFPLTPYMEPTPNFPYYNPRMIGQQTLEAILRSHLEKLSCFVEVGTELHSFEQDDERVLAQILRSEHGEEHLENVECRWLIGADGAKGVTRKLLNLTFIGETRDDVMFITGDTRFSSQSIDREHWHVFSGGDTKSLNIRPSDDIAPDGFQFHMVGSGISHLVSDHQALFDHIRSITTADIEFRELAWISDFRPNVRMVNKFGVGRVFVAGGNVHSPTGGQGMNSSIQDAFNLCWKLSLVIKSLAPHSLLTTYTTERVPVIAEMLKLTTQVLRKTVVLTTNTAQDTIQHNQRMHMLGVNYRTSPIVLDEFTPHPEDVDSYGPIHTTGLVAGDRAPDASALLAHVGGPNGAVVVLPEPRKLFDIFRPWYHTVLFFTADVAWAQAVARSVDLHPTVIRKVVVIPKSAPDPKECNSDIDSLLRDDEGHAFEGYHVGIGESRVFVVRPDGCLGAIVKGKEGLRQYFDGIFGPGDTAHWSIHS